MFKKNLVWRRVISGGMALVLVLSVLGAVDVSITQAQQQGQPRSAPINCPSSMAFGDVAQCSISTPAEGDTYAFSANAGDKILVIMSKSSGDIWPQVRVYNPEGTKICDTYSSSSAEISSCYLPSTGIYTILALDYFGTGTGDYYLYLQRLNNPGAPQAIAFGQTMFDSIYSPAEMDTFTFSAVNGDRVLVRMSKSSMDIWPEARVYNAEGVKVCEKYSSTSAEIASCNITADGVYTILAHDYSRTEVGDYYLHLQRLNDPGSATPIDFGQTMFGSINTPAEMDAFTFDATSGDKALLRLSKAAGDIWPEVRVYNPAGVQVCSTYSSSSAEIASCNLAVTGTYTVLALDYFGTETGDYYLHLQRLNNAGNATSIGFGQTLFESINTPAEMDAFTFTTNYTGKAIIRMSKSAGTIWPEVRVYSPEGIKICEMYSSTSAEISSCNLTSVGTYTILTHDHSGISIGDYYLFLQWLTVSGNPVSISGNAGAAGVTLKYLDGTLQSVQSDAIGFYSITVPSGWSGRVTPSKAGVAGFFPAYRDYTTAGFNQTAQDYKLKNTVVFKSVGARDGWILESGENTNVGLTLNGTAPTLRLGDDAARKQYRSILSFVTGSLPDNAVITKVTLKVKHQGVVGGGDPVAALQGFMADIRQGTFGAASLQAADWLTAAQKTVGPFTVSVSDGWYTLNLTAAKAFINKLATGSGSTQIRLRFKMDDNDNSIANYLSLYSGNAGAASRPQLIIEYYVP